MNTTDNFWRVISHQLTGRCPRPNIKKWREEWGQGNKLPAFAIGVLYQRLAGGSADLLPKLIPTLNPAIAAIRNPWLEWNSMDGRNFFQDTSIEDEDPETRVVKLLAEIFNVRTEVITTILREWDSNEIRIIL